jgi:ADP-heptose:LPS heptosyltransferase
MGFLSNINIFRRFVTRSLTKILLNNNFNSDQVLNPLQVQRVLISRPNHRLGNQILITPLVQEVEHCFPNAKIDLFVKGGVANIIFENYSAVDQIIHLPKSHFKQLGTYFLSWLKIRKYKYDVAINVDQGSSSGRLSVLFSRSKIKIIGDVSFEKIINEEFSDAIHMAKYPVYMFRHYLNKLQVQVPKKQISSLDLRLSDKELEVGKENLKALNLNPNLPTVCLFTFATGSKCYSKEWWHSFLMEIESNFAQDFNLIEILPVENVSQIDFKLPSFYSKDVRAIASLISNTKLFIGADSGMMHLASASKTTTIGLFSVTSIPKYGPFGNQSFAIQTNGCSHQEMILKIKEIAYK